MQNYKRILAIYLLLPYGLLVLEPVESSGEAEHAHEG